MTTAFQIFHLPKSAPLNAGVIMPGAKASFFITETSTPSPVYTDPELQVAHTQPVVADAAGILPTIYLDPAITYKVTLTTAADALYYTIDPANDQVLSQAAIGAALYPQTAAEITAGVTPANYAYPPGDVRRYGAVLNGSTSDHAAFIAAHDQCQHGGDPIYIPRSPAGLATSQALQVFTNVDIVFEPGAFIVYTGSSDIAILTIGDNVAAGNTANRSYQNIDVRRQNYASNTWASEDNIGVRLMNLRACDIHVAQSFGSTIAVQCIAKTTAGGSGRAFDTNNVRLGLLYDCKIALDVTVDDAAAVGSSSNSNNFYGGYLVNDTGYNSTIDRIGVRINNIAGSYYCNNNNFYGMTPEVNQGGSGSAIAVQINYGIGNRFWGLRSEHVDFSMDCYNDSRENVAEFSFGSASVRNLGTFVDNFCYTLGFFPQQNYAPSWQSPPVHQLANEYDAAGGMYFPGMSIAASGAGGHVRSASGFTFTDSYVDFASTRAIGVLVDTTIQKRFVIRRDAVSGNGGRILVQTYDASMTQFTSAGGAHPYVLSQNGTPLQYLSTFGGAYQTGVDANGDVFIAVKDDVKRMWVGVSGGTSNARLRSMAIQSLDGGAVTTMQGFSDGSVRFYNDLERYATGAPVTNNGLIYQRGVRITRAGAIAAGAPGWICVTEGVGGTAVFKVEAAVAA